MKVIRTKSVYNVYYHPSITLTNFSSIYGLIKSIKRSANKEVLQQLHVPTILLFFPQESTQELLLTIPSDLVDCIGGARQRRVEILAS